ncbi:hypothetical protein GGR56DRAFT_348577 [Xylariaceae sp. FL0804]|nr:hypothetical protein GGR56DRAFT_348577 [Xylariaceae sp. FL0804]
MVMAQQDGFIIFNMLPNSVQARLPGFESLRRSTSLSILPSRRRPVPADDKGTTRRNEALAVVEPPRKFSSVAVAVTDTETKFKNAKECAPRTQPADKNIPPAIIKSGVKWRIASQASHMHHEASLETQDASFARRSYIDGVAYMLRALPDDLDCHESAVIQRALPPCCAPRALDGGPQQQQRRIGWRQEDGPGRDGKTLLQRGVASLVKLLVVLVNLLLLSAVVAVRMGAQFEHQYHISENLASRGVVLAGALGRRSVQLSTKICGMSDGRVGRVMGDFTAWTVDNVTAGIQDGLGQGLKVIQEKQR